ncbi:hypothetical protein [Nocardia sp. NPDC050412]|uniref:hypothetical protein n=1 Tax=unclassified Nocardia TaxID=2637762 RepID=UPI0037A35A87
MQESTARLDLRVDDLIVDAAGAVKLGACLADEQPGRIAGVCYWIRPVIRSA